MSCYSLHTGYIVCYSENTPVRYKYNLLLLTIPLVNLHFFHLDVYKVGILACRPSLSCQGSGIPVFRISNEKNIWTQLFMICLIR